MVKGPEFGERLLEPAWDLLYDEPCWINQTGSFELQVALESYGINGI